MNSPLDCPIAPPGSWGNQKPPPGVPVDPSHSLARGLLAFLPFSDGSGLSVSDALAGPQKIMQATGLPATWCADGLRLPDGGGWSNTRIVLQWPRPTQAFALTVQWIPATLSSTVKVIGGNNQLWSSDSSRGGFSVGVSTTAIYCSAYSATGRVGGYIFQAASGIAVGRRMSLTWQWDGMASTTALQAWSGRSRIAAWSGVGFGAVDWSGLGAAANTIGLSPYGPGTVCFACLHNRALLPAEIEQLHSQPCDVFAAGGGFAGDVANRRRSILIGA